MYCNEGKEKTPTTQPKNLARDDKYGAMFERATNPSNPGQHFLAPHNPYALSRQLRIAVKKEVSQRSLGI
jgi:hypothetical protein